MCSISAIIISNLSINRLNYTKTKKTITFWIYIGCKIIAEWIEYCKIIMNEFSILIPYKNSPSIIVWPMVHPVIRWSSVPPLFCRKHYHHRYLQQQNRQKATTISIEYASSDLWFVNISVIATIVFVFYIYWMKWSINIIAKRQLVNCSHCSTHNTLQNDRYINKSIQLNIDNT